MATSSWSDVQFLCSICLDVFTDPVTLPCGHNFCKKCIDQYWSAGSKCMCPYCKRTFLSKPELQVNIFIGEMANHWRSQHKHLRSSEPWSATPEVLCEVCTGPKEQAVKSCLVCRSSYCESHLEPHLNMPNLRGHHLLEPLKDLEKRVCAEHDKPLEVFCRTDQLCICALCLLFKHRSHEVVPLKEASDQQKLQLQNSEANIQDQIARRRKKIDELHDSVRASNAAADREISDGVKVFTPLREIVESGLDLLISEVTKKKTDTEQQAEGLIQEIKQEISELEQRGAELKLLSESHDPLHLLLNSSQLSSKPTTQDWTQVNISAPAYEGAVERALSEVTQRTRSLMEKQRRRDSPPAPNGSNFSQSGKSQNTDLRPQDLDIDLDKLELDRLKGFFDTCETSNTDVKDRETEKGGTGVGKLQLRRRAPPPPAAAAPPPPAAAAPPLSRRWTWRPRRKSAPASGGGSTAI